MSPFFGNNFYNISIMYIISINFSVQKKRKYIIETGKQTKIVLKIFMKEMWKRENKHNFQYFNLDFLINYKQY